MFLYKKGFFFFFFKRHKHKHTTVAVSQIRESWENEEMKKPSVEVFANFLSSHWMSHKEIETNPTRERWRVRESFSSWKWECAKGGVYRVWKREKEWETGCLSDLTGERLHWESSCCRFAVLLSRGLSPSFWDHWGLWVRLKVRLYLRTYALFHDVF